jgi:hypothetical protein
MFPKDLLHSKGLEIIKKFLRIKKNFMLKEKNKKKHLKTQILIKYITAWQIKRILLKTLIATKF